MSHLTEVATRHAVTIVDGEVMPDHPDQDKNAAETGKQPGRLSAAEAITAAQAATSDELAALESGETRSTVLAAIAKRREELTGGENHADQA